MADLQAVRRAEGNRGQLSTLRIEGYQGEVVFRIRADDLRQVPGAVVEGHRELGRPLDDVVVGKHETFLIDNGT